MLRSPRVDAGRLLPSCGWGQGFGMGLRQLLSRSRVRREVLRIGEAREERASAGQLPYVRFREPQSLPASELAHRVCRVLREGAARCGISVTATSAAAGPWVRRCGEARQRAAPEAAEGGRGPPAEGGGVSASVPRAGCARTAWARSKRRGRAGPGGARSASAAAAKLREGNRGWRQGPGWKRVSGG